ncbi:MAG: glycosyltransferase [Deltaproteobacteria bacterium]|nr:glycosyltransferase [Deltaproteobacteria bacterium]
MIPLVSVVIPVYNEENIIFSSIESLHHRLQSRFDFTFEIVISENGSTDRTIRIANGLAERYAEIKVLNIPKPNYGKALKNGIVHSRGTFVICDEIDLCDTDFYYRAMDSLENKEADLVIGSKLVAGARDERPWLRHLGSITINSMLKFSLGFKGTDTHGVKAFRRDTILPVVTRCIVEKDMFASELVIRSERQGKKILEIPVHVSEKRKPSLNVIRRIPGVLRDLALLFYAVRIRG